MSEENINVNENEEVKEAAPAEELNYAQKIEAARADFFKTYKNSRTMSNILMFVMVIGVCGVMFLIFSQQKNLQIIGYIVAGVLLAGMIAFYIVTRKKLPNKTQEYIKIMAASINEEMFNDKDYSDIKADPEEKLKMDDLAGDGIYSGANEVRSRNVIHGVYKKHHFLYAEAALVRPSTRKQQVPPLFVGRYVSVPNDMKFDGRFVLVYKNPKEPLDLPNAVEDLKVLEEKDNFVVYGPEGSNYHDALNNKIVSQLNKLQIEGHLLNLNVVFWGGHTAAYLSYDDAIMSVPFDKPLDKEGFDKSFNDLLNCLKAITME